MWPSVGKRLQLFQISRNDLKITILNILEELIERVESVSQIVHMVNKDQGNSEKSSY